MARRDHSVDVGEAAGHAVYPVRAGVEWTPARVRAFDRFLWVALAVAVAVMSAAPMAGAFRKPGHNKDYSLWYQVGRSVLAGGDLYPPEGGGEFPYMYPPLPAVVVFAPLSVMGEAGFTGVLLAVNGGALAVSILLSAKLATGRALGADRLVYLLPACFTVPYAWDTFLLGQPNLVLLAVVLAGLCLLRSGRCVGAGVCLGAAGRGGRRTKAPCGGRHRLTQGAPQRRMQFVGELQHGAAAAGFRNPHLQAAAGLGAQLHLGGQHRLGAQRLPVVVATEGLAEVGVRQRALAHSFG
ncbi:MAG: DUF2029 domain-containing protein, partial [Phycisphaerales bacterium]|nr:DUF2029 domain-containing protein [Phycisphaerales bacterium]